MRYKTIVMLGVAVSATATSGHSQSTRMFRQPAVSQNSIAFVHANDIWMVGRSGGDAVRITSSEGAETGPHFSSDGAWIAFTGQYR